MHKNKQGKDPFLKVKYSCQGNVRNKLFSLKESSFVQLAQKIIQGFALQSNKMYHLFYHDQQQEPITITSQEDFQIFLEITNALVIQLQETNVSYDSFMNNGKNEKQKEHQNESSNLQMEQEIYKLTQSYKQAQGTIADLKKQVDELNKERDELNKQRDGPNMRIMVEQKNKQLLLELREFKKNLEEKVADELQIKLQKYFEALRTKRGGSFVHRNMKCEGKNCRFQQQIVGARFCCPICNFNICERCELNQNYDHDERHPLVKILNGEQERTIKAKKLNVGPQEIKKKSVQLAQQLFINRQEAHEFVQESPDLSLQQLIDKYLQQHQ